MNPAIAQHDLKRVRRFAELLRNRGVRSMLVQAYLKKHPYAGQVAVDQVNSLADQLCDKDASALTVEDVVANAAALVILVDLAKTVEATHRLGSEFSDVTPYTTSAATFLGEHIKQLPA